MTRKHSESDYDPDYQYSHMSPDVDVVAHVLKIHEERLKYGSDNRADKTRLRALVKKERAYVIKKSAHRFTVKEDREAKHIARTYTKEGYSKKEALGIGYATVTLHKRGFKT